MDFMIYFYLPPYRNLAKLKEIAFSVLCILAKNSRILLTGLFRLTNKMEPDLILFLKPTLTDDRFPLSKKMSAISRLRTVFLTLNDLLALGPAIKSLKIQKLNLSLSLFSGKPGEPGVHKSQQDHVDQQ